jgi:hypothetical protein
LQSLGCLFWSAERVVGDGFSDADGEASGTEPAGAGALYFAEAEERYGEHGGFCLLCEQANAGAKRLERAVVRAVAFREDEHGVTSIECAASVLEAAAKAAETRQWEDVEEKSQEPVGDGHERVEDGVCGGAPLADGAV